MPSMFSKPVAAGTVEPLRAPHDGLRQRVLRTLLDGGRSRQHVFLRCALAATTSTTFGLAQGQRAGLVEDDDVELGGVLQAPRRS